jgi:holo-[acyl-carrier protein] synthase
MKALGAGIGSVDPADIETEIVDARPILNLRASASRVANELGLTRWSVSLTHDDTYAVAFIVAIGGESDVPEH